MNSIVRFISAFTLIFVMSFPTAAKSHRRHHVLRKPQKGMASWYGENHQGKRTASGERFNMNALTAAHRTLPINSIVKVKNLVNGRTVSVRINDRGPYSHGRIIDVSKAAAKKLGLLKKGTGKVEIRVVSIPQPEL